MNTLSNSLKEKANRSARTANGAVSLNSSLSACVDFFSKSGACRGKEDYASSLFKDAFEEDKETALRSLFYTRDVRGGQGEREVFRKCFLELEKMNRGLALKNLGNFSEYGRWDDLFILKGTAIESQMVDLVKSQLTEDTKTENPSQLAKWMPSINASSKKTKALGRFFAGELDLSEREYRKLLSKLRSKISLVEQKLSSKQFKEIDYSKVPSKAGLKYRGAFKRHDEEGYAKFLSDVQNGNSKINTGTLYPYEIVKGLKNGSCGWSMQFKDDEALNTMWDNLPNFLEGNEHNGLVMADVSGSMFTSHYGGTDPILVSLSLALYIAERNVGDFKDLFMTFSSKPEIQDCSKGKLFEKLNKVAKSEWGMATDLSEAFKEILKLAVKNKTPQSELPEVLYIVSDMQFNSASRGSTNFEVAKKNYEKYGYKLPKIVFWNVNASSDQPISFDQNGTALVSGCTPNIFKSILANNTPEEVMNSVIYSERYDKVKV